jgi:nitrogen regulation protein NR(I)
MPTLLVVDDEPNVRYSLREGLQTTDLRVDAIGSGEEAIDRVRHARPDAVVLDVRLPDVSGLEVFDRIRELEPRLPVIIITAFDATDTAIRAMKRGAFEVLIKPVDLDQLQDVVNRAVELGRLRTVPAVFEPSPDGDGGVDYIVGRSAAMQDVCKDVGRVARRDVTVLILGESGTGKELVARAIYQHSDRADRPFLAINCAAIPETLLESELLGHERGAFTGADRKRIGKFEQANGGTLFLDEIGDMTPATQAKVLRLLQEQQFERLGGQETIRTDVRIIAATNQDLESLVAAGKFRTDLYYRLNVFPIRLPPLRERREDIPLLIEHFVRRFSGPLGKPVRSVAPDAMRLLTAHDWPGNVRELQSVIKSALVRATCEAITADCLPESLHQATAPASVPSATPPAEVRDGLPDVARLVRDLLSSGEADVYRKVTAAVEEVLFNEALRHAHGNQGQASERLGISRTTLRAKLRTLGITVERLPVTDADRTAHPVRES